MNMGDIHFQPAPLPDAAKAAGTGAPDNPAESARAPASAVDFDPDPALAVGVHMSVEGPGVAAADARTLAHVDNFNQKVNDPLRESVASRKASSVEALQAAGKAMDDALKAGVDVTRSTFLRKVVGVVASVIALGVMAAATVATGGAAAPALAAACLATLSYAGDAVCAFREWKNAQAEAANDEPPYKPLPCGASAVGNLAFWAARGLGEDAASCHSIAHKAEVMFTLGLLAFSLATCAVPPELKLAEEAIKFASLGIKSMMYMQATLDSASTQTVEGEPGPAGAPSPVERLNEAFDTLTHLVGAGDVDLAQAAPALARRLLDDAGQISSQKAQRMINALEKAIEKESALLTFTAAGANLLSLALVGRELAVPDRA